MSTLSVNNIDSVLNVTANSFTVGNSTVNTVINSSSLSVSGDITIGDRIIHSGDTDTTVRFPSADTVTIETAGSERIRVLANGNIGIGTNSPSSILQVNGTVTSTSLAVGANVTVNTSTVSVGNSTVNTSITSTGIVTTNVTATSLSVLSLSVGATVTWDSINDVYQKSASSTVTATHLGMRRCLLLDNGTVNYYLSATDSTKKADGSNATLTGADGMVMVEIPKFYYRYERTGAIVSWSISDRPTAGFAVHPAFIKNGVEVNNRYIGAYDACFWDATDSTYKSGANRDDSTSIIDTANDKLASVSGIYPIVGLTRAETRLIAAKRGTGWRQLDFWLLSAVQLLYLIEHGTFYSQNVLGNGNTNVTNAYNIASSANQTDSPHSVAGKSNSLGNASTNTSTGAASATRDTAFMSYRGIENWYGNCWNWVDGLNVNVSGVTADGWYVNNNNTQFADDTVTNYARLTTAMPADGYVTDFADVSGAFIPSATTGGSSSTFITDQFFDDNDATNRVALFGGDAGFGAFAGAFFWGVSDGSSVSGCNVGGRLAF